MVFHNPHSRKKHPSFIVILEKRFWLMKAFFKKAEFWLLSEISCLSKSFFQIYHWCSQLLPIVLRIRRRACVGSSVALPRHSTKILFNKSWGLVAHIQTFSFEWVKRKSEFVIWSSAHLFLDTLSTDSWTTSERQRFLLGSKNRRSPTVVGSNYKEKDLHQCHSSVLWWFATREGSKVSQKPCNISNEKLVSSCTCWSIRHSIKTFCIL